MQTRQRTFSPVTLVILVACVMAGLVYYFGLSGVSQHPAKEASSADNTNAKDASAGAEPTVDLNQSQLGTIQVEPAKNLDFFRQKEEVGSVAYHEKDDMADAHADAKSKFVVANILESDGPLIRLGQPVEVRALVYPDQVFSGKVATLGVSIYDSGGNPAVDPNTHRMAVRCEIADPENKLYPGMLATVRIRIEEPVTSVAVPQDAVVREGDGTMTVWTTSDHHRFTRRTVRLGLEQNGYDQILEGLKPEELVATRNAIFISNMSNGDSGPE